VQNSAISTRSALLLVSAVPSGHQSDAEALDTVRFFTSHKWQEKFADVAAQFVMHRSNIESDLKLHITVINTHDLVSSVDEKVNTITATMELVFAKMQTSEEKELAAFVEQKGGVEYVLENEVLLKEVLEKQKGKGSTAQTSMSLTVPALKEELRKDVETILAENTKSFEQKFGAMVLCLREVPATIQRQSDRVPTRF
jgi:hypothetical protein